MRKRVVVTTTSSSVLAASRLMAENGCGALPVMDGELQVPDGERKLVGIVTDRDIVVRACTFPTSTAEVLVAAIMSPHPVCCSPDDPLATAEALMLEHRIKRVLIVDAGKLVGILSLADIAQVEQPLELARITRELGAREIRLEHH
jgi:CBS domain-containing protein